MHIIWSLLSACALVHAAPVAEDKSEPIYALEDHSGTIKFQNDMLSRVISAAHSGSNGPSGPADGNEGIDNIQAFESPTWIAKSKEAGSPVVRDNLIVEHEDAQAKDKLPKSKAGTKGGKKKDYEEDEISVQDDEEMVEQEAEPASERHDHGSVHSSDDAHYYKTAIDNVLVHACSNREIKSKCEVGPFKGKCKENGGIKACSP